MRILVVGRTLPSRTSSSGIFEYEQAIALRNAGQDVVYACSDNTSIKRNRRLGFWYERRAGMRCICLSVPLLRAIRIPHDNIKTRSLIHILSRLIDEHWVPDIVYAHFPVMTLTDGFVSVLKGLGIPLVCMEHWTSVQANAIGKRDRELLKTIVDLSAAFCCVSEDLQDSICNITGVSWNDIYVIPNMVNESLFNFSGGKSTKPASKAPTFISCGRLIKAKRVDTVIKAFAYVKSVLPSTLRIVGDGPERNSLEHLAGRLGLLSECEFSGWRALEDVASMMRCSSCYVSASVLETFCVPYAEAWMCGIPCVGPATNPLRQYFNDKNGMLFPDGDVYSLANAMSNVAKLKQRNAYDEHFISDGATALFSRSAVVPKLLKVFNECLY